MCLALMSESHLDLSPWTLASSMQYLDRQAQIIGVQDLGCGESPLILIASETHAAGLSGIRNHFDLPCGTTAASGQEFVPVVLACEASTTADGQGLGRNWAEPSHIIGWVPLSSASATRLLRE
jgi:hypothetical protein